jgi:hypothetical protein
LNKLYEPLSVSEAIYIYKITGGHKNMNNKEIRAKAKEANVYLWQVAEAYGMRWDSFSKLLRHELPDAQQREILRLIDKLNRIKAKPNNDLRKKARAAKVPFWRIADALGISELTFIIRMRRELELDEKLEISDIIDNLREEA